MAEINLEKIKGSLELELEAGIKELIVTAQPKLNQVLTHSSNADRHTLLKNLYKKLTGCKKCPLYKERKNLVLGEGNPYAALMFIGEAPGRDEDLQGRPFVGRAGQLLTKMIEAMGLRRQDVYIANCLKCRPPENRNPLPEELEACRPNIESQISIIRPKVICTLGKFATYDILKIETPITAARGRFYEYAQTKVMPTFHPAYLLRNPSEKKTVWQDLKKIMKELNIVNGS